MEILNKLICLTLNSAWQPVGQKTVKDAVCAIMDSNYKGINIDYEIGSDGLPVFDNVTNMEPVSWDRWVYLPVREWDLAISSPSITIRVPTVLVATQFRQMPRLERKMTSKTVWERDSGRCQYTGKKLTKTSGNLDHVVPKSRGGKDTWENLVLCDKEINTIKGNKLPSEVGLSLINEPKKPNPQLLCQRIKTTKHADWRHFII